MYEIRGEDLKKYLQKALSAAEVTHAYLADYLVHLFIVIGKNTNHYLYIKDDKTPEIINQIDKYAVRPLNAADKEKRYFLDKDGLQIVDEDFDTFYRMRFGRR